MGSYSIRAEETELAALASRAEAGEEIVLSRDGKPVAKVIPFPMALVVPVDAAGVKHGESDAPIPLRPSGQNFLGLAGTDLSWLDEPLPEDMQRAFGMID